MKRWISSISITLVLLLVAFFLPLWAEPNLQLENNLGEIEEVTRVSTVNLIQRQVAKAVSKPKPAPQIPPDFPTVASAEEEIEELPKPEPEEIEEIQPEEIQEEPEETKETTEESSATTPQQEESTENSSAQQGNFGQSNSQKTVNPEYRQYVLQRIASKKTYPRGARSKEQEGVVRLSITISPEGKLLDSQVVGPCEHSLLNEASLLAVKKAAPFKKMPAGMEELNLVFSIDYSLQ